MYFSCFFPIILKMSKLFKTLCEELGLIYKHSSKSWVSHSSHGKPMMAGVIYSSITTHINGKEEDGEYHLFDGDHEETPWQYAKRLKTLQKLKNFSEASVKVFSRRHDYSILIRFENDEDFIEFDIVLGKHVLMNVSEKITKTEVKRALANAKKVVKCANFKVRND